MNFPNVGRYCMVLGEKTSGYVSPSLGYVFEDQILCRALYYNQRSFVDGAAFCEHYICEISAVK